MNVHVTGIAYKITNGLSKQYAHETITGGINDSGSMPANTRDRHANSLLVFFITFSV